METSLLTGKPAASTDTSVFNSVASGTPSDVFTKLLVAQIKNQNPLEPSDPSQFVNQLAQLSQMESLQKLASQTSANATTLDSLRVLALGAQVGSQVRVRTDSVALDGETVQGGFTLQSASSQATLVLTAHDGSERRVALGRKAAGEAQFSIDPAALGLSAGTYGVRVDTDSGESPAVEIGGKLSSVRLSASGSVVLDVSNVGAVPVTSITRFNGSPA